METVQKIALVFTIIGALTLGLVGFFDFNLITSIFEDGSMITRILYSIIGVCSIINIGLLFSHIERNPR